MTVDYINIGENDLNKDLYNPIINCDENRIMQVLLGLQSNALKFTKTGSVKTAVEI